MRLFFSLLFFFFNFHERVTHFEHEVHSFHLVVRYHHAEWRLGSNTSMGRSFGLSGVATL